MTATPAVFDNAMATWLAEQAKPWAKLKYKLTQANLARHLPPGPVRVLDAGGGNGLDSIPLAAQGHLVDLVDFSQAMLADAAGQIARLRLQDRVTLHPGEVGDIHKLFPQPQFDVVLCHNVLQYVEDVPALLAGLLAPLKPGGLISLLSVNRYSIPYHAAFFRDDLAEALSQLDTHQFKPYLFGATATTYSAKEISKMLAMAGGEAVTDYGIRCIFDYWGDNDRKMIPEVFEQLEELEFALTDQYPYKLLARYYQVIGRKA